MANKYEYNPLTNSFERKLDKEAIAQAMVKQGANFDCWLLLQMGERQHLLAR